MNVCSVGPVENYRIDVTSERVLAASSTTPLAVFPTFRVDDSAEEILTCSYFFVVADHCCYTRFLLFARCVYVLLRTYLKKRKSRTSIFFHSQKLFSLWAITVYVVHTL